MAADRVLIADDHVAIREGVARVLGEIRPFEFEFAATHRELTERLRAGRWDLVILDLNMPDRNPFDLLSEIKAAYPTTKVLVYSIQPEGQVGVRVLKAGADGFLAKSGSADELIAAVDRVLSGKRFISESLADDLALAVSRRAASPAHALLSDREYLVLKLLGSGCTPTVIAEQLHMSVKTVSSHRARILQKLNLNSTADLIRYAVEERL